MTELRKYQEKTVNLIRDEIKAGNKKCIIAMPTGAGKSIIIADIAKRCIDNGHRVLILTHMRQLVTQMSDRCMEYGQDSAFIMAGMEYSLDMPLQIGTIQTYRRRIKLEPIEQNRFFINASVVIIDEAHKSLSRTYQEVLGLYEDKIVIGVTATPVLGSGMGMGKFYDAIVDPIGIQQLIDEDYLVPVRYFAPSAPDLSKIKTVLGDYEKKSLGKIMEQPKIVGDVFTQWAKYAGGRQTMIFAVNVKHSKAIRDDFIKHGVNSEHLDAHSPDDEREDVIRRFVNGDIQAITNVGLYTEGTDIPEIECISIARPTKSMGLWRQMGGRGLRPSKGKKDVIIIDHGGCVDRLGFIEDDVEWSLDGKKLGYKKKIVRKKEKTIMTCDECQFVFTGHACPNCGFEVKGYAKKIAAIEADLVEIGKNRKKYTMEEKKRFMGMAEYHRKIKGYAKGWSSHLFRSKFLVWPNRFKDVAPIMPDKSFYNYLTYKNIQYHKGKQKQEAAA